MDESRIILPDEVEEMTDERLSLLCEMLVRAYDPCISCSVHLLDVEFIE